MKRRHSLAAAAALLALPTRAQMPTPLVVGFDEGSPPTMYRAGSGPQARGIYPALVSAAFASMGRPGEMRALPFKRLLAETDGDLLLAGAVIRTPERERRWLFSQPYFVERLAVYSTGEPFRSLADLAGKRVGVIRGWSYGEAFDTARRSGEFQCEEVSADLHNFSKLLRGRLDYAVVTELGGRMLLQLPAFAGRQIVAGAVPLGATPIHLAVQRDHPGAAALLAAFNAAIQRMHRDGMVELVVAREVAAAAELVRTQAQP